MTSIIEKWLLNSIGLNISLNSTELGETFNDGRNFAKILSKYRVCHPKYTRIFFKTDTSCGAYLNLKKICVWLKLLEVPYTDNLLHDIANKKSHATLKLLYELFIKLEGRENVKEILTGTTDDIKESVSKCDEYSSNFYEGSNIKSASKPIKTPLLKERKTLQLNLLECRARRTIISKLLSKKEGISGQKADRKKPRTCPEQLSVYEEIERFEKRNLKKQEEAEEDTEELTDPDRLLEFKPKTLISLSKIKHRLTDAEKNFEYHINKYSLEETWRQALISKETEARDEIAKKLYLQSEYEKEKCMDIKSSLIRCKKFFDRKEQKNLEDTRRQRRIKNPEEPSGASVEKKIFSNKSPNLTKILHEFLYKQNMRRRKKITSLVCRNITHEIIDMAIVQSNHEKECKAKPPKDLIQEWQSMFCRGNKLLNISWESETPDKPVRSDVDVPQIHSEYYNYITLQGTWEPDKFNIMRKSERLNVIGYIVHRIIDLKNTYKAPLPGMIPPHKYRVLIQLYVPPNLIELMQNVLLRSRIIVFDACQAITYALIAYKIFFSGDGKGERKENVNFDQLRKRSAKESELFQEKGVQASEDVDIEPKNELPPDIIPIAEIILMLNRQELELPQILNCFIIAECIKCLRGFDGWVLINFPHDSLLLATLEYLYSGMEVPIMKFHTELSDKWNSLRERLTKIRKNLKRLSHCYLGRNINKNIQSQEKFKNGNASKILRKLYVLMVKPLSLSKEPKKNVQKLGMDVPIHEKLPILPKPNFMEQTKYFESIFSRIVIVPDIIGMDSDDGVSEESEGEDDISAEYNSDTDILDNFVFADDFPWKDIIQTRSSSTKNILRELLQERPEGKSTDEDETIVIGRNTTIGKTEKKCKIGTENEDAYEIMLGSREMEDFYNTVGLLKEFSINKFNKRRLVSLIKFILNDKKNEETMYLPEAKDLGGYDHLIGKSKLSKVETNNSFTKTSLSNPHHESVKVSQRVTKVENQNVISKKYLYPGHSLWRFTTPFIPTNYCNDWATFWETRELSYERNLRKTFKSLQGMESEIVKQLNIILEEPKHCTEYNDRRNELVSKFQDMLSSISKETRSSKSVKNKLNCSIFELQNSLWKMSDFIKIGFEDFLFNLNDKIDKNLFSYLLGHFCLIQEELDRFIDTLQLVTDYYFVGITKFPSKKKLNRLFLSEVIWTEKMKDDLSDNQRLQRNTSLTSESANQSQKETLNNTSYYNLCFNERNILLVKEVSDLLNMLTRTNNTLKCKINGVKCHCSKENKAILSEMLSENNFNHFKNVKRMMVEWDFAIDEEIDRILFRLELINEKCKESIVNYMSMKKNASEAFSKKVAEKYQTEITNIEQLCEFLKVIVAEDIIVNKKISLEMFTTESEHVNNFQTVPVKQECIPIGHQFTVQQIKNLFGKMAYAAPWGILKKYFIYILEDMVLMGHELGHPYLPPFWSNLPSEALRLLVDEWFGRKSVISWKEFIVFALGLPNPTLEEIILMKVQLKEIDSGCCELITYSEFELLSLWFDKEITPLNCVRMLEVKKILFQMFQTGGLMNYRCFLLTFCRDENPQVGFIKALAVVNDDITNDWIQKMFHEAEQIENKNKYSLIPEGCIGVSLNCFPILTNGCKDEDHKRPIISALLDLYSGPKCDVVNFQGLQQLAALETVLKGINTEFEPDHIEIKLQVLDSCSSAKGARLATLKSLVAAEQTCIQTPLFLGILGNEKKDNFLASHAITKVFNIAHILPYAFEAEFKAIDNVHYISTYPVRQHTQAMKLLFMKLGLRRITVVHENSTTSKMRADHLTEKLQEDFCFNRIIKFTDSDSFKRQLGAGQKDDGLVVIFDDAPTIDNISESLNNYEKHIIISLGKVGVQNHFFTIKKEIYVLQMTSVTSIGNLTEYYDVDMMKKYDEQQLKKCLEMSGGLERFCNGLMIQAESLREKDWTVDLLQYGLILYSSSLRSAAFKKCRLVEGSRGLCPELNSLPRNEWNDLLKESSVFSRPHSTSIHEKITFNMNIPAKFTVYLSESSGLTRIGTVENNILHLYNGYSFPVAEPFIGQVRCNETVTLVETPPPTISTDPDPTFIQFDNLLNLNMKDYEVIGFLGGVASGILFLIIAVFYAVYRTVRVKSSSSDKSSCRESNCSTNSI